jgi:hypothetical protein
VKLGDQEKQAIGRSWNYVVAMFGKLYAAGIIQDVNSSAEFNANVMVLDQLVKQTLASKDCGCDDKKGEKAEPEQPQPVAKVQNLP